MIKIIPTIFGTDIEQIENRIMKASGISKEIQIDFMDGDFVPLKSPMPEEITPFNVNSNLIPEAHLMCFNPHAYFKMLSKKGFRKVLFHFEAYKEKEEIRKAIREAKKNKMRVFIVLNPKTECRKVYEYFKEIDGVMLMGVQPGLEGQKFIPSTIDKVKLIRNNDKNIDIQIDGGVNENTIAKLAHAGANIFSVGSALSGATNPKAKLKYLEDLAAS